MVDALVQEREWLSKSLGEMGFAATSLQLDLLLKYVDLLLSWNKKMNLIGLGSPKKVITTHILDSLSGSAYIEGSKILDLGSGAGLPGIPLSIMNPDKTFYLLDCRLKRMVFLRHVKNNLNLKNIELLHMRVENYQAACEFDTILCRAFAPLGDFINLAKPLASECTYLLAYLGKVRKESLGLPFECQQSEIIPVVVPGLVGERHMVKLKLQDCPE